MAVPPNPLHLNRHLQPNRSVDNAGESEKKRVAIVQSNYIPWRGYFDLINSVDEFVLLDTVQFTRRDWRNRNQIKTPQGLRWLSIPVRNKGKYRQTILDTEIDGSDWASRHWRMIEANYRSAPYFTETAEWLAPLYLDNRETMLSSVNRIFLESISNYLGITTTLSSSSDYCLDEGKTMRLVSICQQAGATEYVSGPAARQYLQESDFDSVGITVTWFDYAGYSEYSQLWGGFEPSVTILDILLNLGPHSLSALRKNSSV